MTAPVGVKGSLLGQLEREAQEAGQEFTVERRGYPDPLLLLPLGPVAGQGEASGYEFTGLVLCIVFADNVAVNWYVFQEDDHIMHPHMGGSNSALERHFCFGSNASTLEDRFGDLRLVVFFGLVKALAGGYYRAGAYRNTADMTIAPGCRCTTPGHSHICDHCLFADSETGQRAHWRDMECTIDDVWTKAGASGTITCASCGRLVSQVQIVVTADGNSACTRCTKATSRGLYRSVDTTRAWTIKSSGGEEVLPKSLVVTCGHCNRQVEHGHAPCSKAVCTERRR